MKQNLVIIVGPTAVGKTSSSVELAKRLGGEIISADSMQIYKGMDIGTAKIEEAEMEGIPHYMIDEVNPDEEFSVSDFKSKALHYIDEISSRGKLPIVVGGTGLYVNSLVYKLDFTRASSDEEIRSRYTRYAEVYGKEYVYDRLRATDPATAERLNINDVKRVIRALEVYELTGKPMSESNSDFREESDQFNLSYIGLNMERENLYERINRRVDIMLDRGLIEEVKSLLDKGYGRNHTSMKAIGYKEVIDYIEGVSSYEEMVSLLKRNSRRFAKRQLTWFRRDGRIKWFDMDKCQIESMESYCKSQLEER